MKYQKLGNKLNVSKIGIGCMGMSFAYGEYPEAESIKTLHHAIELGVNFFDTAELYGPYRNEILLGKAFKHKRDKVIIATKFGFAIDPSTEKVIGFNSKPEHVKAVAEASLKRLGVEVIDLFYQHRVDPEVPIEETVGAMAQLVKEGKVRALGLSEAEPDEIKRAHATHPITALQSEYSLWTRSVEHGILPLCKELGIGFVPYSPLGRGFFTGKFTREMISKNDFRSVLPRFSEDNFDSNQKLLKNLNEIAKEKQCTMAQLVLAWLMHQDENIFPIVGVRRMQHLEENLNSLNVKLDENDQKRISEALPLDQVKGDRYSGGPKAKQAIVTSN